MQNISDKKLNWHPAKFFYISSFKVWLLASYISILKALEKKKYLGINLMKGPTQVKCRPQLFFCFGNMNQYKVEMGGKQFNIRHLLP